MERKLFWGIMTPGAVLTIGVRRVAVARLVPPRLRLAAREDRAGRAPRRLSPLVLAAAARLRRRAQRQERASGSAGSTSFRRSCCSPRCSWLSSSPSNDFFATAPRGLEALAPAGACSPSERETPVQVPGGVAFGGGWEVCYRANLWSRIASRVLWKVHSFSYASEADVYDEAKALDWPKFFAVGRTMRVNVTAQKSPLKSLEFATLRIKDAVCDRFRDAIGQASGRRPRDAGRAHACLPGGGRRAPCTSTPPASRCSSAAGASSRARRRCARTWRRASSCSPAGSSDEPLLDPMCGGGTLLAEAAAMARGRAPGREAQLRLREAVELRASRCGRSSSARRPEESAEPASFTAATTIRARSTTRGATSPPRASSAG